MSWKHKSAAQVEPRPPTTREVQVHEEPLRYFNIHDFPNGHLNHPVCIKTPGEN